MKVKSKMFKKTFVKSNCSHLFRQYCSMALVAVLIPL